MLLQEIWWTSCVFSFKPNHHCFPAFLFLCQEFETLQQTRGLAVCIFPTANHNYMCAKQLMWLARSFSMSARIFSVAKTCSSISNCKTWICLLLLHIAQKFHYVDPKIISSFLVWYSFITDLFGRSFKDIYWW